MKLQKRRLKIGLTKTRMTMMLKTRKTVILGTWVTESASFWEKFEDLGQGPGDLENMKDVLADDMGGLDSRKDLEEDIGNSETGTLGLGELIEDLDGSETQKLGQRNWRQ